MLAGSLKKSAVALRWEDTGHPPSPSWPPVTLVAGLLQGHRQPPPPPCHRHQPPTHSATTTFGHPPKTQPASETQQIYKTGIEKKSQRGRIRWYCGGGSEESRWVACIRWPSLTGGRWCPWLCPGDYVPLPSTMARPQPGQHGANLTSAAAKCQTCLAQNP